ncbi:hypothetical protein OROMI_008625 [Orobanche minor]
MNMDGKNAGKVEGFDKLAPPAYAVAAVAVSGSKKGKHILNWALEKFVPQGLVYFKLLHVRPVISRIPTPITVGNYIPISQVREDVADAFRKEIEWQVTEKLLPYKRMCSQRKVQVEIVQIESDDVETAISGYIQKHEINKLVIGVSSRRMFSRAQTLSSRVSECCPAYCSVYAVSKGKLSSMRPSVSETNRSFRDDSSETTSCSTDNSSSLTSSSQTDWTDKGSFFKSRSTSLPEQRFQALSDINQTLLHKRMHSNVVMQPIRSSLSTNGSDLNHTANQVPRFTKSRTCNTSGGQTPISGTSTENQVDLNLELEKLRIELRRVRGKYAMTQGESIDASRKVFFEGSVEIWYPQMIQW